MPALTGHRRPVVALASTAIGVASGSYDRTVRLWDPTSGTSRVLRGHANGADALAVTPDGAEVISVSREEPGAVGTPTGEAGPIAVGGVPYNSVLALSPDAALVVTATVEHTIEVWDRLSARRLLAPLIGHTGYVENLVVTPGSTLLVSGSWDRTLRFWDLRVATCGRCCRSTSGSWTWR
jgi:WD40 repeat protein